MAAWEIIRPDGNVAYLVWCRYCQVWHEHVPAEAIEVAIVNRQAA